MITSSSIEPALPNKSIHQMENESLMFIIIVTAEEYENPKDYRREKSEIVPSNGLQTRHFTAYYSKI